MQFKFVQVTFFTGLVFCVGFMSACSKNLETVSNDSVPGQVDTQYQIEAQAVCNLLNVSDAAQISGLPITVSWPSEPVPTSVKIPDEKLPHGCKYGSDKTHPELFSVSLAPSTTNVDQRKNFDLKNDIKIEMHDEIQKGAFVEKDGHTNNDAAFHFTLNGKMCGIGVRTPGTISDSNLLALGKAILKGGDPNYSEPQSTQMISGDVDLAALEKSVLTKAAGIYPPQEFAVFKAQLDDARAKPDYLKILTTFNETLDELSSAVSPTSSETETSNVAPHGVKRAQ